MRDPHTLLVTGMVALLLANLLNMLLRWTAGIGETLVSLAMGLLYGVSFTTLLLSVRLKARRRAGLDDPPC